MKSQNHLRVLLDSDAYASLENMLEALKGSGDFVKINPSKLVSWIITKFEAESFERNKAQIIQDHFNSKEYLRDLATKIQSSDNAADVLAAALQKIQLRSKKINVKKTQKKSSQKKIDLKNFKIVLKYNPQDIEDEKRRFRILCQLIFPNLASASR